MAMFADTAPAVLVAALPMMRIDPCGDDVPFAAAVKVDLANVARIRVPVLVVEGGADAFSPGRPVPTGPPCAPGSTSVTLATVPGSGHAITLSRHHAVLNRAVDTSLRTKLHIG